MAFLSFMAGVCSLLISGLLFWLGMTGWAIAYVLISATNFYLSHEHFNE